MRLLNSTAVFLLLGLACTTPLPGEVDAGLFDFRASTAQEENCKPDMSAEGRLEFEGRFRLESNLVDGYFVYRNTHRAARFDGQKMLSVHEAEHSFVEGCENCEMRVVETLEVVLLSESQDEVLENQCPCNALSESIPVDEAQNIFPPRPVPGGFDAVRACGTLTARVVTTPLTEQGCPQDCHQEDVVYYIEGIRRE
jgi:hypothetical protein